MCSYEAKFASSNWGNAFLWSAAPIRSICSSKKTWFTLNPSPHEGTVQMNLRLDVRDSLWVRWINISGETGESERPRVSSLSMRVSICVGQEPVHCLHSWLLYVLQLKCRTWMNALIFALYSLSSLFYYSSNSQLPAWCKLQENPSNVTELGLYCFT